MFIYGFRVIAHYMRPQTLTLNNYT